MRPIDADAVLKSVKTQIELTKQMFGEDEDITNILNMLNTTFKRQLDLTPTLDVIPVEWIKEWFNTKMDSTLLPRNYEMVCNWMIYDWEREHEIKSRMD